jgi:DNA-binding transcriptional LysR family regulator
MGASVFGLVHGDQVELTVAGEQLLGRARRIVPARQHGAAGVTRLERACQVQKLRRADLVGEAQPHEVRAARLLDDTVEVVH